MIILKISNTKVKRLWIKIKCVLGVAIDVHSQKAYPRNVLSNLYNNQFSIDGIECQSMEGFLQSLKFSDPLKQREICAMKGVKAKKAGNNDWKVDQQVYWNGKIINRGGEEFQQLISRAYKAMFEHSETFRKALADTKGKRLYHTIGIDNLCDTILTTSEFCNRLTELRTKI